MESYVFIEAALGIIAGILLAVCTKKAQGVTYGKLDIAGIVTNVVMLLAYACVSPLCLFIGALARPAHDGFLGVIGVVVSFLCASTLLVCGLGLGASVALRKKGRSKLSFWAQFAGVAAFALMFVLFLLFYGNLLAPLN